MDILFHFLPLFVQKRTVTGQRIRIGHRIRGLYQLEHLHIAQERSPFGLYVVGMIVSDVWHRHLGNICGPQFKHIMSFGALGNVSFSCISTCIGCRLNKQSTLLHSMNLLLLMIYFTLISRDLLLYVL